MEKQCPVCGETKLYQFYNGWSQEDGQIEPEEGWCDYCGFGYQQYTPNPYADKQKDIENYLFWLEGRIDDIDNEILEAIKFKEKIPELNKRINWDNLKIECGWKKINNVWTKTIKSK